MRVIPPSAMSAAELTAVKHGRRISVCLPARNEVATVGPICAQIHHRLVEDSPLVDELLVLDDGSSDATADSARRAGATVLRVADVLVECGPGQGKGNVLWASVAASTGDIVVWCDSDVTSFTPAYVTRLVAPLLIEPDLDLVKGFYVRNEEQPGIGGGRTTELLTRPLLSRLFPELATVRQPLGGEYAATRTILEQLPFVQGYGVEVGLLIDALRLVGAGRLAQVDLGYRTHRHRPLAELADQAAEILHVVLDRAGVPTTASEPWLWRADGVRHRVPTAERPALVDVAGYARRSPCAASGVRR